MTKTELSYEDAQGNTIFTSAFYRKKGSCCKSSCLHCPFGFTLNKVGVELTTISSENEKFAREFFNKKTQTSDLSSSLLGSAFGKQQVQGWEPKETKMITLKGYFCGLLLLKNGEYLKHYLKDEFSEQGINESYIRGLL